MLDGELQLLLWPVARDRVGRIEHREVAPDDLILRVPLDVLGAHIPRRDDALRIEQEDAVVANILDEKPEHLVVDEAGLTGAIARRRQDVPATLHVLLSATNRPVMPVPVRSSS